MTKVFVPKQGGNTAWGRIEDINKLKKGQKFRPQKNWWDVLFI